MEEDKLLRLLGVYHLANAERHGREKARICLQNFFFPFPSDKWEWEENLETVRNIQRIMTREIRARPWDPFVVKMDQWAQNLGTGQRLAPVQHYNPYTRARF
jgi:hypothetical protein